ncbi:hypothetical protein EIP86_006507 [Pleurotus ostreatoroseus]|nr:hypothetical protein EIP86_006507 [Pleurotus ostreatoroseus]
MEDYKVLTAEEQAQFFLENGYVVINNAFTPEKAAQWSENIWVRLGMDESDRGTWTRERIHMPWHKREPVATFSPKAWDAMCDLLGGAERIDAQNSTWGDSFIVNLGTPELEQEAERLHPRELDNWHVDGDFFVHFLDSPEQALLVIPLFTDIKPSGGATYIAPEGIRHVAQYLAAHPEGVVPAGPPPRMVSSTSLYADPRDDPEVYVHGDIAKQCGRFVEMTGHVGDVVLLHPLMLHSASKNYLREARVIVNPPVALREPFGFDRARTEDYSLVELKTLRELGVDRLDFKPSTERRRLVPKSLGAKAAMLEEEKRRLAAVLGRE